MNHLISGGLACVAAPGLSKDYRQVYFHDKDTRLLESGVRFFANKMGTDRQQELTKKKRAGRIGSLACGMDGTRTRDPLRDRQVF